MTLKGLAALMLVLTAVSCGYGSPVPGGLTGVTVNADGQLTMVAAWCGRAPDGVAVYRDAAGELLAQARIKAPPLTGGIASMNLEEKPAEWSLREGSLSFDDGQTYMVRPYSTETHVGLESVYFTTHSKQKIPPAKIMIQEGTSNGSKDVLLTENEFRARAKHYC